MHPTTPLTPLLLLLASRSCAYTLLDAYAPGNFFSSFDFFTDPDPTTGFVKYHPQSTAATLKLIGSAPQASNAIYIGVDSTTKSPSGRASVRISSKKTYNKGLFIADIAHMPGGICGVWPAFWMLGSGTWPANGEIDILEGVNDARNNSMTLHTNAGCRVQKTGFSGTLTTSDCDVSDPAQSKNAGCQIQDPAAASYGTAFNQQGGAVIATEVTSQGIKIWSFPRSKIPAGIESPDPSTWGMPVAAFAGECDIDTHFKDMSILFDTTFCGQWAGDPHVWAQGACAAKAPTCQAYVQGNPQVFGEAYWLVNSVKVYEAGAKRRAVRRELDVRRSHQAFSSEAFDFDS